MKDGGESLFPGGDGADPTLKVTKDRIYLYAPENREVVICDRDGVILAYRSISEVVEKISTHDGYHLTRIHQVDFTDAGESCWKSN